MIMDNIKSLFSDDHFTINFHNNDTHVIIECDGVKFNYYPDSDNKTLYYQHPIKGWIKQFDHTPITVLNEIEKVRDYE